MGDSSSGWRATCAGRRGFLCLEQRLGADAAAVVFLMADLDAYPGRLYLGAYAQCLGASGITFYDDAVSEFFGPPEWSPMLTVVLGPEGPAARSSAAARRGCSKGASVSTTTLDHNRVS